MAFDIHPSFKRVLTPSYQKADGSAGSVEGAPEWTLSDATLANITVNADGMGAELAHNGAVGEVTLTVRADGDLGAGVFPVVISEVFTMLAPLGATAGTLGVGDEVPV